MTGWYSSTNGSVSSTRGWSAKAASQEQRRTPFSQKSSLNRSLEAHWRLPAGAAQIRPSKKRLWALTRTT